MAHRGEHQISIGNNASRSGERVGTGIYEEVSSPPIKSSADECWINEVQKKMKRALEVSPPRSLLSDNEGKNKIFFKNFDNPVAVTIGPLHRWKSTRITDQEKWHIVHFMNHLHSLDLAGCLIKMKNQVANALRCYSDSDIFQTIDTEDAERFAEILFLDSYFILFMLTSSEFKLTSGEIRSRLMLIESDSSSPSMEYSLSPLITTGVNEVILQRHCIVLDLLIIDNQIPFFVIEELFKELKLEKPLHKYALEYFEVIHPRSTQGCKDQDSPPKFLHLLDLFHWSRVPKDKYHVADFWYCLQDPTKWASHTPTATELTKSKTVFKKKTSCSSLDIIFQRGRLVPVIGVLSVPSIHIHYYSRFIFSNLMAFEAQCPNRGRCTMAFSTFMRNLLQREEDVKLLRRHGILTSTSMTDNELVDFFKHLSKLTEDHRMPRDLYALYDQVLSHHNRRMSRFCGSVVLRYCPNPLVTLSVFGAFMIFVLTLLQTTYTMLTYYHK